MRRWNGWGDDSVIYPLPSIAKDFLTKKIGTSQYFPDISFQQALASVPASTLPDHDLIKSDPDLRLRHARGQSLPDWIALRSGRIDCYPDGVTYPNSSQEIKRIISFAKNHGIHLIPYGGGTSVVGHINPLQSYRPNLTIDLSQINKLIDVNQTNNLATCDPGICGADLEIQLNQLGMTLGHFPQSFEYSTLGGWIVTRSCGQQSYYYGRIEDMFAGGSLDSPVGTIDLNPVPASAAGPDLRQVILGSEGIFGIVSKAIVRIHKLPLINSFYGLFFPDWKSGVNAIRVIAQENVGVSMLRLSDSLETETTFALSGKEGIVRLAKPSFRLLGLGTNPCLLIFGTTGSQKSCKLAKKRVLEISREFGGFHTGQTIGSLWMKSRFKSPYLRNTLWDKGYALDTLETALPWAKVAETSDALQCALELALAYCDEKALVIKHLSHIYNDGASIYVTIIFRRTKDPDELLDRWQIFKNIASEVILNHGGTISHQHGVGIDHAQYLPKERGHIGIQLLQSIKNALDPDNLFNPGKLLP